MMGHNNRFLLMGKEILTTGLQQARAGRGQGAYLR